MSATSVILPTASGNGRLPQSAASWRDRMDPRKRIAIVGKAPDTLKDAPWDDPSWQIWILNDMVAFKEATRWDACFEIHSHPFETENEHRQWLRQSHGKPIFLNRAREEVPDGIPLPLDELLRLGRYYTNTVSYMLGLAILLRPDEIGLWGVNMAQDDEYAHQRPSCEYFCGVAVGQGIKLTVPKASDLLKAAAMYGVERSPILDKMDVRSKELQGRLAQARAQENHWTTQRIMFEGMVNELRYWEMFAGKQA